MELETKATFEVRFKKREDKDAISSIQANTPSRARGDMAKAQASDKVKELRSGAFYRNGVAKMSKTKLMQVQHQNKREETMSVLSVSFKSFFLSRCSLTFFFECVCVDIFRRKTWKISHNDAFDLSGCTIIVYRQHTRLLYLN